MANVNEWHFNFVNAKNQKLERDEERGFWMVKLEAGCFLFSRFPDPIDFAAYYSHICARTERREAHSTTTCEIAFTALCMTKCLRTPRNSFDSGVLSFTSEAKP